MVKVFDFTPLAGDFEFQLAYKTPIVLLSFSCLIAIMHGGAPEVFLHQ
jgi:hypothetical protein